MFEGSKIDTMLECVTGFLPRCCTNIRESILTVISFLKWKF